MYTGSLGTISNRETWDQAIQLYDSTIGPDAYIDLTGASITMTIRDQRNKCHVITASSPGQITITGDPGVIQLNFSDTDLNNLCGTYDVGIRLHANGITRELFRGTVSILEGYDRQ